MLAPDEQTKEQTMLIFFIKRSHCEDNSGVLRLIRQIFKTWSVEHARDMSGYAEDVKPVACLINEITSVTAYASKDTTILKILGSSLESTDL